MIELTQAAAATVRDPLVVTLFGFVSADCYRISCFAAIHAHAADRRLFQSFYTARQTIRGFEATLWLRKGFDFAGAWTVSEQNRLPSVCFGLSEVNKA
jgi:hypothetical protein